MLLHYQKRDWKMTNLLKYVRPPAYEFAYRNRD